jgi:hypothetical protein
MVDYVSAGNRFKLRFGKAKIYFWFSLNSVKCLRGDSEDSLEYKWDLKAKNFSSSILSQRDVQFEIDKIDKFGNVYGAMFY